MTEMWKREEFLIANGLSQLPNSSMTNDLSPYDYFDGGSDTPLDISFSELRGRGKRKARRPKRRVKKSIDNTRQRMDNRRREKTTQKQTQATNQQKAIEEVNKASQQDAMLLAQLTQTTPPVETPPKGMTKGTKTALIIGGVAVLGVVGFMLYKKFKK